MLKRFLFSLLLAGAFLSPAQADNMQDNMNSPVGLWITISDKTHDPSGIVNLYEEHGKIYGKITKIFPGSGRDPKELCTNCPGNFKNKPVLGLVFLWDFQPSGDNTWSQGEILDPKEGGIYRGSMELINGGKQLKLRGYWGIFWRTQIWNRVTLPSRTV